MDVVRSCIWRGESKFSYPRISRRLAIVVFSDDQQNGLNMYTGTLSSALSLLFISASHRFYMQFLVVRFLYSQF